LVFSFQADQVLIMYYHSMSIFGNGD